MRSPLPYRKYLLVIFLFSATILSISFSNSALAADHFIKSGYYNDTIPVADSSASKVFEKVEIEATFPGGETAWRQYLQQNLNANTPVDKGAPAGSYTVWIQFIVDKEGKLSDMKMLTHQGYGMEPEVMRILRKSPSWLPAEQDGKKVKAYRKQPVTFVIQEEKKGRRKKD